MKDKKIKRYILGYGFVTIRPYLTHNEIDAIIEQAQNTTDNYAFRQEIADACVMTLCTDIEAFQKDNIDVETIDAYEIDGVIRRIMKRIKGYKTLVNGIENLSVKDVYRRFETALEEFTNEFKNVDLNGQEEQFKSVLKEREKVSKEKEEILNGK